MWSVKPKHKENVPGCVWTIVCICLVMRVCICVHVCAHVFVWGACVHIDMYVVMDVQLVCAFKNIMSLPTL